MAFRNSNLLLLSNWLQMTILIPMKSIQNDSIQELTEKVFDSTISEILNVRSNLIKEVVEEAIETLANAKRVEFYAFGGSVPIAMDAQHKFFRLKIPSSCISDPHIQFMSANSLTMTKMLWSPSLNLVILLLWLRA